MPIRGYLSPQNVELAYALASPLARSVLLSLPNPLTGRSWRPCPPQHLAYECILTLRGAPIAITLLTRSKHLIRKHLIAPKRVVCQKLRRLMLPD